MLTFGFCSDDFTAGSDLSIQGLVRGEVGGLPSLVVGFILFRNNRRTTFLSEFLLSSFSNFIMGAFIVGIVIVALGVQLNAISDLAVGMQRHFYVLFLWLTGF